jgi:hypothetical protein
MIKVMTSHLEMSFLRGFLKKVGAIFVGPLTESQAEEKLAELTRYAARKTDDGCAKSIAFLQEHFNNMTTLLSVPGMQRNSEAETGTHVWRRWERNHDGFCNEKGRSDALRIYQSVAYLG